MNPRSPDEILKDFDSKSCVASLGTECVHSGEHHFVDEDWLRAALADCIRWAAEEGLTQAIINGDFRYSPEVEKYQDALYSLASQIAQEPKV